MKNRKDHGLLTIDCRLMSKVQSLMSALFISSFAFIPAFAGESGFAQWLVQEEDETQSETIVFPIVFPPEIVEEDTLSEKKKSVPLGLLYSLLLPGSGQLYMGSKGLGKGFLAAEGVIWLGFAGFTLYGHQVRNDYRLYAASAAGALGSGSFDETYFNAMEFNLSSEEFNAKIREDARRLYPYDPKRQEEFVRERIYTGGRAWVWPSADALRQYKSLRRSSRFALLKATYALGLALVNRVVSAMNVIRTKDNHEKLGLGIEHDFEEKRWQVGLRLSMP